MDTLLKDLAFALRNLRRSPGFVAVILATLALGVGANVAIFAVVDGMLVEALPYADAQRVVRIWDTKPSQGWDEASISSLNFVDWKERSRSFEDMAIFQSRSYNLSGDGEPERIEGTAGSANLLRLLGREPATGRDFRDEEDDPGAAPVVVLSDRLWQRRFAGDPGVVGSTLRLDGVPHTVAGIMPAGFFFPGPRGDLWVATAFPADPGQRGSRQFAAVARLRDGVSEDQAQADLAGVAADLEREFPDANAGWSVDVETAIDELLGDEVPQFFALLLLAVGFVALIACANIASLLLSRAVAREREVSVRTALGATRARILRQLLTETMVLAATGGAVGVAAAFPMVRLLLAIAPPDAPRIDNIGIDGSVLAYAAAVTLATSFLFGLVPALQASRPDLNASLKDAARGTAGTPRHRLLRGLVAAEVALATALVALGVLSVRSLQETLRQDPGFDTSDLLTFQVNLPETKYPEPPSRILFFEFPPWPWVSLVLVGLVLGGWWVERTDAPGRARYLWGMAAAGGLCLAWFFGWDWWAGTPNRWMFTRDFSLNKHWTPRGDTLAWIMGAVFCQIALFYYLVEIRRWPSRWLVILGQTALFLYFTHHLIVLTLINQWLGERFNNWWIYSLANALLVLLLVAMGRGWQEAKRWYRDHGPALGVFGRA